MKKSVDLADASVTLLIEKDGIVHLAAMPRDKFEAIVVLVKGATSNLIETNRSQSELLEFIGYRK